MMELMAFGFVVLRTVILRLPFKDTQTGFKAFSHKAAQDIFRNLKIFGKKKLIKGAAVKAGFDGATIPDLPVEVAALPLDDGVHVLLPLGMGGEEQVREGGELHLAGHAVDGSGILRALLHHVHPDALEGDVRALRALAVRVRVRIIADALVQDAELAHELEQLPHHLADGREILGDLLLLRSEALLVHAEEGWVLRRGEDVCYLVHLG